MGRAGGDSPPLGTFGAAPRLADGAHYSNVMQIKAIIDFPARLCGQAANTAADARAETQADLPNRARSREQRPLGRPTRVVARSGLDIAREMPACARPGANGA